MRAELDALASEAARRESRLMEGNVPGYDLDRAVGAAGERLTAETARLLAEGRVEVKTDVRALDTGNVYLEHASIIAGAWAPSGIVTTEAEVWAFVVGPVLITVPVSHLRALRSEALAAMRFAECSTGENPTKGVLVPLSRLVRGPGELERELGT